MRDGRRGVFVGVLAWLGGAAAAIVVGIVALSSIGGGSLPDALGPLPPDSDVQAEPARPGAASTTSDPTPRPSTSPASPTPRPGQSQGGPRPSRTDPTSPPGSSSRVIANEAGSVVAECRSSQAYLVSWSPEPGYRVDTVHRGPAEVVSVRLRSDGQGNKAVMLKVRCVDGTPQRVGGGNDQ